MKLYMNILSGFWDAGATLNQHWLNTPCLLRVSQQTQDVGPMLFYCWSTVYDAGPILKQHWTNVLCLLCTHQSRDRYIMPRLQTGLLVAGCCHRSRTFLPSPPRTSFLSPGRRPHRSLDSSCPGDTEAWGLERAAMLSGSSLCTGLKNKKNSSSRCRFILLCKAKRQYLLTWKVRRYCLSALHGSIVVTVLLLSKDSQESLSWQPSFAFSLL